jgi:eukaryotic translation initiation factor 2C
MSIPNGPFYQYEIRTTPAALSKSTKSRIFELAESTAVWKEHLEGLVAHDHLRKLVSSTMLPQPLSIDIPYYNEGEDPPMEGSQARRTYNLTIKFDRELETESLKKSVIYSNLPLPASYLC